MIFFNKVISFISDKPEEAGVYVAIATLVVSVIVLFAGKSMNNKKIFKQRGGKDSQNIQGDNVNVTIRNKQWK